MQKKRKESEEKFLLGARRELERCVRIFLVPSHPALYTMAR